MRQIGGLIFLLLPLWIDRITSVADRLRPAAPASPHTTPSFIHGFAIEMTLTIVAVGFSIAAFRGHLRLLPGVIAFLALVVVALAVGYFR